MATQRDLSLGTIFTADVKQFKAGVAQVRASLQSLYSDMARGAARASKPLDELGKSQALLNKRYQEMAGVNNTYNKSLQNSVAGLQNNASAIKDMVRHYDGLRKTVNAHAAAMNAAGKDGAKYAKTVDYAALSQGVLTKKLKQTSTGFVEVARSSKNAGQAFTWIGKQIAGVTGAFNRLGAAFKVTAAYAVAATAIYKVVDSLRAGVEEIVAYDQALRNLQAITGATSGEVMAMGEKIRDVARTTKFSVTEVADGMVLLGQAGLSAGESIDAMQAVSDLATGTMTDLELTTDLLSTAIRAFQLESFQAGQVADIFANAINKSKLTVDKLRVAFNYIGPAAQAAGADLEEVTAAMMTLSNSGLRASTIGTGLRQIFARLVAPSAKLREAFEAHNITTEDLDISTQGFTGVLENLADVFMDTKTGLADSSKAFELFGLRGANAIVSLVKAVHSGEFKNMLDTVYEVGSAANMAAIQMEGLALKMKNLKDRVKELAVEIGDEGLASILHLALDALKEFVLIVRKFVETDIGKVITNFVQWTTATYALAFAIGLLGDAVKKLAVLFYRHLLLPMFTTWTGGAILAIGAIVAAFQRWTGATQKQINKLQDQRIKLRKSIDVLEYYQKSLKQIKEELDKTGEGTKKYENMLVRLGRDFKKLAPIIEKVGNDFEALNEEMEKHKGELFMQDIKALAELSKKQREQIEQTKLIQGLFKKIGELWDKMWILIARGAEHVFNLIVEGLERIADLLSEAPTKRMRETAVAFREMAKALRITVTELKEYGAETDEVKAKEEEHAQTLENLSQTLMKMYKEGKISIDGLRDVFAEFGLAFFETDREAQEFLDSLIERIKKAEEQAKHVTLLPDLEPRENIFKKLFDEADADLKVGIARIIKSMKDEMSRFRKEAADQGYGVKDLARGIVAIRIKALEEISELIYEEEELLWQKQKKQADLLEQHKADVVADAQFEIDKTNHTYKRKEIAAEGNAQKLKNLEKRRQADILSLETERIATTKVIEARILRLRKEYIDEELAYRLDINLREARRITDETIAEAKREGAETKKTKEHIALEVADLEVQFARERLRLQTEITEKLLATYGEESDQFVQSRQEMKDAQQALNDALADQEAAERAVGKKKIKLDRSDMEDRYKAGEISAEQYFDYIQQLRDEDLISEEEYQDKKALLVGSYFDVLKRGIRNAKKQMKSMRETIYDIVTELPEMLADGFINAFEEVADGSKKFGEAMAEMFANIILWIGQTILKLLLMQMIMRMVGMAGAFGSAAGSYSGAAGGAGAGAAGPQIGDSIGGGAAGGYGLGNFDMPIIHEGGVIGKDRSPKRKANPLVLLNARKLHDGMKKNEYPAILQRGEGVFTEGQMDALGARLNRAESTGTSISVPVNVEYTSPRFTSALRSNIEDAVRKTLRQELR